MNIRLVFYNTFSDWTRFEMPKGSRPWNVFLVLAEGEFSCRTGGEEYTVKKNEIAYFPRNQFYRRQVISPLRFHQLAFLTDEEDEYMAPLRHGKLNIPPEHVQTIVESLDTVSRYFNQQNNDIFCYAVQNIIMENYIYSAGQSREPIRQDKDVALAIQYMSDHLNEKINIKELAEMLHLSDVGLIWKFNRSLNRMPARFLIMLRMQKGKQLLTETNLRISEISQLCGYSNAYYFSNAFRKFFHMTPSEMRASHKIK